MNNPLREISRTPVFNIMNRLNLKTQKEYCIDCFSDRLQKTKRLYKCLNCGHKHQRSLYIDPLLSWWLDNKRHLWHTSASILVFNKFNKLLVFKRTRYPYSYSIPGGHVNLEESLDHAAKRELEEEIGLKTPLKIFKEESVVGDKCRGGFDRHLWGLYKAKTNLSELPQIKEEGENAIWVDRDGLNKLPLAFGFKYFVKKYGDEIWA